MRGDLDKDESVKEEAVKKIMEKQDAVNHPSHYNTGKIEVIEAIDDWQLSFSLGNAVKYIARAGRKGDKVEDLRKAVWYLNHEIEKETEST